MLIAKMQVSTIIIANQFFFFFCCLQHLSVGEGPLTICSQTLYQTLYLAQSRNALGSHIGTSSDSESSTSIQAPSLGPGKAVKDCSKLSDPASMWETQKNLLAPASNWLISNHCGHLGHESSDGRVSSLSLLLCVYLTFQFNK